MRWVVPFFCWIAPALASDGYHGHRGHHHGFQALLKHELEVVKATQARPRQHQLELEVAQARQAQKDANVRLAEAKKAAVIEAQQHENPIGYQTLLKFAEREEAIKLKQEKNHRVKHQENHLGYQTLLKFAEREEAIKLKQEKNHRIKHEQDHLGYQTMLKFAEREEAIKLKQEQNHNKRNQEKQHPGYQQLIKEAEEAERENLEADEQWAEESPRAERNWQRAHNLFEELHGGGHAPEHSETSSDFLAKQAASKYHPGFQNLLKDELTTEREEIEAEHEEVVGEKDDQDTEREEIEAEHEEALGEKDDQEIEAEHEEVLGEQDDQEVLGEQDDQEIQDPEEVSHP